jgi:rhamnose transport system permease protein
MLEHHRREISVAVAILAIVVMLSAIAPGFFTWGNQRDLLLANMPVLIVGLGMTLVLLTGHIDISVGSQFAICGVIAGGLAKMGLPVLLAGIAACTAGALLGAVTGALVAHLRIPSIVVTLAAMVAFRDGLRWTTEGTWIQDLPPGFQWFGLSQSASATLTMLMALMLFAVFVWRLGTWRQDERFMRQARILRSRS